MSERETVELSTGWGVLHLFFRVDVNQVDQEPGAAKRILDALDAFTADGTHSTLTFTVLGHKADVGVMALNPGSAVKLGRVVGGNQSLDDVLREMRLSPLVQVGVSYSF